MKLLKHTLLLLGGFLFSSLCLLLIMFIFFYSSPLQYYTFNSISGDVPSYQTHKLFNSTELQNYRIEIINFYISKQELNSSIFNKKEIAHYTDVKRLLMKSWIAFFSIGILFFLIRIVHHRKIDSDFMTLVSRYSVFILLCYLPILFFFSTFWNSIFHQLLFTNEYWINTPQDISFYIFPEEFFKRIAISMYVSSIMLSGLIWAIFRKCKIKKTN